MILKRLEVYGFKSFADKLDIEFNRGISAIVGPNGSGKSNVTDAIRWVLGEQNLRNLRGSKVEDIIFAGSSTRKPLNMAEVSIVLDNSDKKLPIDFEEVMITRRIFRSGESEFFINRSKCRLKDIYNLLADTGLGKNSFSVIGQNKVDEVLNTKPEDRRYLFEECAGITKYRDRKKEAVKKLDNTQNNIIRLNDIVFEVENQLEPLREQAEKTRQYNEIYHQYQDCELTQILFDYEDLEKKSTELNKHLGNYQTELLKLESSVNVSEADKIAKKTALTNMEKEISKLGGQKQQIHDEIERSRNQATLLEERIKSSCEATTRLSQKKGQIVDELALLRQNLKETKRKVEIVSKTADKFNAILMEKKAKLEELEKLILQKEAEIQSKEQFDENKRKKETQISQEIAFLNRDLQDIDENIKSRKQRQHEITSERIEKNSAKEFIDSKIKSLHEEKKDLENNINQQEEQIDDLKKRLNSKKEELSKIEQDFSTSNEKYKIYKQMQDSYEGFGKAVKQILYAQTSFSAKICGAVAKLINVPNKYTTAIEIALGNAMQNVVTVDEETAKEAIEYLKENRLGRVTFMPLTTIQNHSKKRIELKKGENGFIDYADNIVQIDEDYRIITHSLLSRIAVVDNLDNALKIAKIHSYKIRIVTLGGELLQLSGALTGGVSKKESGYLKRAQILNQLEDFTNKCRQQMRDKKIEYDNFEANIQGLEEKLENLKNALHEKNIEITKIEMEKVQIKDWFIAQENLFESLDKQIKAFLLKQTGICEEIKEKEANLEKTRQELSQIEEKYAEFKFQIEELRQRVKIFNQEILKAQINATESTQEVIASNERAKLLNQQIIRTEENLQDISDDILRQDEVVKTSSSELEAITKSLESMLKLQDETAFDYSTKYKRMLSLRSELTDMDEARSMIQGQVNQLKDKIHRVEISLTKIDSEISQINKSLWEKFELTVTEALSHRLEIEAGELKKKLQKLEKELEELGTVNPNAIGEYEALLERYSFMQSQIADLEKAKKDLTTIIEQIDKTMAKQFKMAFSEIKTHFDAIFKRLFDGGYARVYLTDEGDVLKSGIEIEVEPPEKKLQSLSVLSGGERTLTVIALLFAFFTYNPAPFSVLDEIDAPLDESNISRFARFLKDYSGDTQFILVTHRKGTMEAADVMYGVTIEDAGVSKLLSVKLEEYN